MIRRGLFRLLAALILAAPLHAEPLQTGALVVNPDDSRLSFQGSQEGTAFTGIFSAFSARIEVDETLEDGGQINATVDTGFVNSNNEDRDTLIIGEDWLAIQQWPKATFASTAIKRTGPDEFVASGNLTLRDSTNPVELTFSLKHENPSAETWRFTGQIKVSRLAFGVGRGDWVDTRWVGDLVTINIDLSLIPAP